MESGTELLVEPRLYPKHKIWIAHRNETERKEESASR